VCAKHVNILKKAACPARAEITSEDRSSVLGCTWAGLIGVPVGGACSDNKFSEWGYAIGLKIHNLVARK